MARTSKAKKTQEAAVPMNVEIFEALRQLEKERGIPVDYMVDRIKQALVNAYRKDREDGNKEAAAENVVVELTESAMSMVQRKVVVEEVEEPTEEIALDAARKYDPNAKVGDTISIPINIEGFGRIAAQTAKQVIIQGIREAERGAMADSYSSRVQEIFTGTVVRILPETGDMIVRVGQGTERSDAILRASEQIPGESYREGDLIRVYVIDVRRSQRGLQILVSRTHPNLVRRLFELEVPEIADGQVEVRNIAREPGSRTKIAVRATEENIDPVGACVGPRGNPAS